MGNEESYWFLVMVAENGIGGEVRFPIPYSFFFL
jgi:hypothetical protein